MKLQIRSIQLSDVDSIISLSRQLGYKAAEETIGNRIAGILASQDHCAFVAVDENSVIGWIHGFRTMRIETDPFMEIGGLVVNENYRQQGIGRMLVQTVVEWAQSNNISAVRVRCNVVRKEAHLFYQQIGFTEIKEQKIFSMTLH